MLETNLKLNYKQEEVGREIFLSLFGYERLKTSSCTKMFKTYIYKVNKRNLISSKTPKKLGKVKDKHIKIYLMIFKHSTKCIHTP
jgi:hypothetical protein